MSLLLSSRLSSSIQKYQNPIYRVLKWRAPRRGEPDAPQKIINKAPILHGGFERILLSYEKYRYIISVFRCEKGEQKRRGLLMR